MILRLILSTLAGSSIAFLLIYSMQWHLHIRYQKRKGIMEAIIKGDTMERGRWLPINIYPLNRKPFNCWTCLSCWVALACSFLPGLLLVSACAFGMAGMLSFIVEKKDFI